MPVVFLEIVIDLKYRISRNSAPFVGICRLKQVVRYFVYNKTMESLATVAETIA